MRAPLRPKELEDQIREAVHDARLLIETRRGIDHAEYTRPSTDAVEIAELAFNAAEHRERREARGPIALLDRQISPYLAERRRQSAVRVQRTVSRHVGSMPKHAHQTKRQHDTGRRFDGLRQNKAERLELRG